MNKTSKINYPDELPIVAHRDEIIEAIDNHNVVIIAGDTGSGKTTQLPKMCLEAGRGQKKMIGCTQPRRIAAITVASRVAEELGENFNDLVGHKIRFQDKTTGNTKIKFMTDGILLAETRSDPGLYAYDTLIIDEAHERSLNIDFLLGYVKQLLSKRKDLKVIITSATIDTEKFATHFNNAPIIEVSGRTYPVEVRYRPAEESSDEKENNSYIDLAVQEVLSLRNNRETGDILIFMPTERDINETVEILNQELNPQVTRKNISQQKSHIFILPLFGRLRASDQGRVFRPFRVKKSLWPPISLKHPLQCPAYATSLIQGLQGYQHIMYGHGLQACRYLQSQGQAATSEKADAVAWDRVSVSDFTARRSTRTGLNSPCLKSNVQTWQKSS